MTQTLTCTEPAPFRFTVEQYRRLIDAGILKEGDPYELIEGRIVAKMTKGRPHVIATQKVNRVLLALVPPGWHVEIEPAIVPSENSEPEPDVCVIRGRLEEYLEHPRGADVSLVIEVSDSSLSFDRTDKKAIYAAAGIPVYWIVNLVHRRIELFSSPTGPAEAPTYQTEIAFAEGQVVPLVLDGETIGEVAVSDLLP